MDAIELLKAQHREVEALFGALGRAKGPDRKDRLFDQIADKLAVHASIEEIHFYPAVKARRTQDILLESLEEHLGIKRVLADLLDIDALDETFDAKIKVLEELVRHHVDEEEHELFPKVKKLMDRQALESLASAMEDTETRLLEIGTPRKTVPGETSFPATL